MSESQLHGLAVGILRRLVVDVPVCGFCRHVDLQPSHITDLVPSTEVHEADRGEDKYQFVVRQ